MSEVFDSIMRGLNEAIEDAKGNQKLPRKTVTIYPVKVYDADDVKRIRKATGFSPKAFAEYLGVSRKTVEAWEKGTNTPAGTARRMIGLLEADNSIPEKYNIINY